MQHPEQFVESLIQLRSHYQSLQEESERSLSHTKEQLSHVNALLVDQVIQNQQFVENLAQLRAHYQKLYEEQQQKVDYTKEQLNRVNALLADQLVWQHTGQQPLSIGASLVEHQALVGAIDHQEQLQPTSIQEESTQSTTQEQELPQIQQTPEEPVPATVHEPNASSTASEIKPPQAVEPTESVDVNQSVELPDVEEISEPGRSRHTPLPKRPLLPQYARLTKQQAVEQVMRQHSGSILDTEYVIYAVHGKLEPQEVKEEKLRMNDTLRKGVERGLWDKVPDSPGCYTLDLKLVESHSEHQGSTNHQFPERKKAKDTDLLLPYYQDLSFIAAVEEVVRENAGQILTTEKVAKELYGSHLEGPALTQAKAKVGKTLWTGASQGLWQRVPNKLGAYTLDLDRCILS